MKYFLPEYLKMNNPSLSKEAREEHEREWTLACKRYAKYVNDNKGIFTKSFLNEYFKNGFHDYIIKEISLKYITKSIWNVEVRLAKDNRLFILESRGVVSYSNKAAEINSSPLNCYYTYGEFFLDDKGLWNHNFLFGDENEVNVVSKRFVFKKSIIKVDS